MKTLKNMSFFVIAVLAVTLLPFSGLLVPLFLILATALLLAMSVKWNYFFSLFATAFSILLICFTARSLTTAFYLAVLPIISYISASGIYFALKANFSVKSVLLSGTVGYFLLIVGIYIFFGGTVIVDLINTLKIMMLESIDTVAQSVPTDSSEMIAQMKNMYEIYFENLKVVSPSIILSAVFLISYFTLKFGGKFSKDDKLFEKIPAFSELHAPTFLILVTVISYVGQLSGNGFLAGLMANIFMALSVYYALCGVSLIDFFTKKRVKKLSSRILIYLLIVFVLTFLSFIIFFANPILIAMVGGMIDSIVNYRTKVKNLT